MLTLQTCAATTTGTSIPPGGGLDMHSVQVSSSSSSPQHYSHAPSRHSFCRQYSNNNNNNNNSSNSSTTNTDSNNSNIKDNNISAVSAWNSATSSIVQQQQQRQNRKRLHEDIESLSHHSGDLNSATGLEQSESTLTAGSGEASLQCPRLQAQQLCLPRKRSQSLGTSLQQGYSGVTSQCQLDPNAVKANFVDCLVGAEAQAIGLYHQSGSHVVRYYTATIPASSQLL
ncbi:hypothetical protein BGX26_009957 [Mortierella sp. AD094]|nr:hypothetical protein BGX26_009957 [Mortierella sp. AD094]